MPSGPRGVEAQPQKWGMTEGRKKDSGKSSSGFPNATRGFSTPSPPSEVWAGGVHLAGRRRPPEQGPGPPRVAAQGCDRWSSGRGGPRSSASCLHQGRAGRTGRPESGAGWGSRGENQSLGLNVKSKKVEKPIFQERFLPPLRVSEAVNQRQR